MNYTVPVRYRSATVKKLREISEFGCGGYFRAVVTSDKNCAFHLPFQTTHAPLPDIMNSAVAANFQVTQYSIYHARSRPFDADQGLCTSPYIETPKFRNTKWSSPLLGAMCGMRDVFTTQVVGDFVKRSTEVLILFWF
jgi:hypothetical protein